MSQHPHDAPVDDSTISGGLGLTEQYFDQLAEECIETFKGQSKLSEAILVSGRKIRDEELDVPGPLSRYEKKLLLAGYFLGKIHAEKKSKHDQFMKMMEGFMKMEGLIGGLDRKKAMDQEGED